MTKRKKGKKDGRRRKEMAAYREMIRRIRKGEVKRLLWKSRNTSYAVEVLADHIYMIEAGSRGQGMTKRIITPGALARSFEESVPDAHWATD